MRIKLVASALALSSLFAAAAASAQETTAQPAAAPPPVAGTTAPRLTDDEADEKGRLWIGFNVGGGVGTGAHLGGPAFDAVFRAGWVFNRQMAVYGNITGLVWIGALSSDVPGAANVSLSAIAGTLFTPMFAFTPDDMFEVAVGPSLDHLSGGSSSVTATNGGGSVSASAFSGLYFGAQGRLALHLGGRNGITRRRRGFTLSADIHPSFVPGGPVTFITGGLGADWF